MNYIDNNKMIKIFMNLIIHYKYKSKKYIIKNL